MAEIYDMQAIMNALKEKEEMDPDKHDGCYQLMRETIKSYAKLDSIESLDYKDLNLVYLTTVGTFRQGLDAKKQTVNESHLLQDDKKYLVMLWDEIWEKAGQGEYGNYEASAKDGCSIGLFGTGFFSFKRTTTNEHVQEFIRMCIDILPMTDDNEMFDRAEGVLTESFQGMKSASASMILHCLKPFTFPVLNANTGYKNIFEVIGVILDKSSNIETYIDNCRRIKAFRDQNFTCKNYRIYDIAAQNLDQFNLSKRYGKFDSWDIIDDNTARKTTDMSFFKYKGAAIPRTIRWFFGADNMDTAERFDIVLVYDGFEYDARIQKSDSTADQTRIFWDATLAEEFEPFADDGKQHILEFRRNGENRYEVEFVEASDATRVWLITWNKNNWHWDKFAEKCEDTKTGKTFIESWACANSNPKIGDEVFLIKLGEQPRGLIGHGTVVRTIYEKEHYDIVKAAEGKKERAIDVEFDRLINCEKDKYIDQAELVEKCGAQHWSPQNSGIEIKPEVLPTLRSLWESVIKDSDEWWPSLSEYDPGITVQEYHDLFLTEKVVRHSWLKALYEMYMMPKHLGTCKQMGERYGYAPSHYIS